MPGFYNPSQIDGKGVDPNKYLCVSKRGPTQCDAASYWKLSLLLVLPYTVHTIASPVLYLFGAPSINPTIFVYSGLLGIFLVLTIKDRGTLDHSEKTTKDDTRTG